MSKKKIRPDKGLSRKKIAKRNGQFLQDLSKELYTRSFKVGMDIVKISDDIVKRVKKGFYRPLHPPSIELNDYAIDYTPFLKYDIKDTDVVSFTIGTNGKKNGKKIPVRCAYTIGEDYHYLIRAVSEACQEGMTECGPGVKLTQPSEAIEEVLKSYVDEDGKELENIKSLYNLCGYNLENPKKIVPNLSHIPGNMENLCTGRMKEDEIYFIDVYGTNLDEHCVARYNQNPTMFKAPLFDNMKNVNKGLAKIKVRHARELYNFIKKHMGTETFALRELEKRCKNSWRKPYKFKPEQLSSLTRHGLIQGYASKYVDPKYQEKLKNLKAGKPVSEEESKVAVVHFGHSIYITENGNEFLC